MSHSLRHDFNPPNTRLTVFHVYEMHDAARSGRAWLLETLIKMGVSVDAPTRWGDTPLLIAAQEGHADCVKVLIAHKANLNARNKTTHTPLMLAEREGHADCAALLREAGADTSIKTFYGYKAADFIKGKAATAKKPAPAATKTIFRF